MLKHAIGGATALMLATTALARAEVDAQTIWSDWQDVYARFGGTLSADAEEYAGGTLTLENVSVTNTMGGDTIETAFGTVTMIEQPDGTVRIELPAEVDLTTTSTMGGVEEVQDVTLSQDGLSIVASETDGVRTYAIEADQVTVAMTQQMAAPATDAPATDAPATDAPPEGEQPGDEIPPTDITVTLTDLASTYRSGLGGDADAFAQEAQATSVRFDVDVQSETDPLTLSNVMQAVEMSATGSYGPAPTEPVQSLSDADITYDATFTHSGSTLTGQGGTEDMTYSLDGTSASGATNVGLSEDQLSYAVTSTAPSVTFEASNIPLPIEISMAEFASTFALPAGEIGEEKPFGLSLALRDLVASDVVWAAFDPTGQLPREPATLVVDVEGTAVMSVDLSGDPEAMAALDGPPGELKTLNLVELTLEVAGAALRGSGALTFPESGPDAGPVPQPVGTIELALDGGFGLLDNLVALGVLPAEQVAFIKGMSGAVAENVGEDQLESTIEFTLGGGITANGLPLR